MEVVEEVIVAPRRLWWRTSVDCLWLVVGVDNRGHWCNWVQLYTGGLIILLIHSCSNQNNSLGGPLYFGQIYLVKPITYLIACEINGYLSDLFTRILVITPSQQYTEYLGWVSVVVGCWERKDMRIGAPLRLGLCPMDIVQILRSDGPEQGPGLWSQLTLSFPLNVCT